MNRPNVIQIIADQHHADLMGCAGHPQAITPNLDKLAGEGVRFTAAYAQNPICTPSRVSVLSGQYCQNTGYYGLSGPTPERLPSFMGHFKRHGYRTAAFGKLHLPHEGEGNWLRHDVDRLADSYESTDGRMGRGEFLNELEALGLRDREDSWHNDQRYGPRPISRDAMASELPYEHTQERWCVREALDFIDREHRADDGGEAPPFCLQVAFQKPHHPLLPQKEFWDKYPEDLALPPTIDQDPTHRPPHFRKMWHAFREEQWDYAGPGEDWYAGARRAWRGTLACVTQIDDVVGHLLRGLEDRGLRENTIIVYHSDHGCYHGIHGIEEKAPGICSDAVCRLPMIWSGPGILAEGALRDAPVENVDLAPTLAALCGLPAMEWTDGCDLGPALAGTGEPPKDVAVTENPWSKAMRWGRWRFVHYSPLLFDGEDFGELYDMAADPDETRNLYQDPGHKETVDRCRARLVRWLTETRRPVTTHPPFHSHRMPGATKKSQHYPLTEDGKAPNSEGPAENARRGRINYL